MLHRFTVKIAKKATTAREVDVAGEFPDGILELGAGKCALDARDDFVHEIVADVDRKIIQIPGRRAGLHDAHGDADEEIKARKGENNGRNLGPGNCEGVGENH